MLTPPLPEHPFTTAQAARLGRDRKALSRAVRDRVLVRVFTGVYLRADCELTVEVRAQAAKLVISPHSVLCDRTAAWLLGVDAYRYAELDLVLPLESCVLRGHDPTDRRDLHGRTRDLRKDDYQEMYGVLVTTPARTAVDLACQLSRREAMASLDALARAYSLTPEGLQLVVARFFRRRGVIQARQLVPLTDRRHESAGESWTKLEIADRGLPLPEPQWWIYIDGISTFRLDFAYPRARVVVEYDGQEFHTRPEDRARDRERRKWLHDHGWKVIVLTKESFSPEAADAWIAELRDALALR